MKNTDVRIVHDILNKISDPHLQLLLEVLENETDTVRITELISEIKSMIHSKERDAFLSRFAIKDFDCWLQVLEKEEQSGYQSSDFYAKPMLEILLKYKDGLEPKELIKLVLEKVKDHLSLADFHITPSMRIRYDSMMRGLAEKLKGWQFIESKTCKKKKKWVIADRKKVENFLNNKIG